MDQRGLEEGWERMSNPRDTQFQGFAELLINDLFGDGFPTEGYRTSEDTKKLIAQRGYDFACYVMSYVSESMAAELDIGFVTSQECISEVPDLTEWPKVGGNT